MATHKSDYNLKRLLKQEPAAIVGVLNLWFAFLVAAGIISWSALTITALLTAINGTLLLLYVRASTVSKDGLREFDEGG